MKIITFFNNKGGVGKTTTAYPTAWMLSELGIRCLAVDLDPQSNLTTTFLSEGRQEEVYQSDAAEHAYTILNAIEPVIAGESPVPVHIEEITDNLGLILGDLSLSTYEDKFSDAWLKCLDGDVYAFRIMSLFQSIICEAAARFEAEYVLIDVGPNFGAINRAVLLGSDIMVIPVTCDLYSLQGMKNIGMSLNTWKNQWRMRLSQKPEKAKFAIPRGEVRPIGYIVMQYSAKESRPVKAYLRWANRIPQVFRQYVLSDEADKPDLSIEKDPYCIALLKHYRSLAPMSMEAHKPIFLLKPADGAIGAHLYAVKKSYEEFQSLTESILRHCQ